MDTRISRRVNAPPRALYDLAARVEDWPRILPHYRWVRVLDPRSERERIVEMAARREVLEGHPWSGIPLRWTARQRLQPEVPRVEFEHTAGPTRGMRVAWTFSAQPDGMVEVAIRHVFTPAWPVPSELVRLIVGEYFVNGVAARTLRCIGTLAELAARRQVDLA